MPTHTRPATSPARGDSTSNFFLSNPVPGEPPLRYRFENQIESSGHCPIRQQKRLCRPAAATRPSPLPSSNPSPSPARKAEGPGPAPKGRPPQSAVPLRRTNPRPGTTPQAKAAGRLVSHTPSAASFAYLRLVPRSPSAAFVSYLGRANPTRDWQTSAKLARLSHRRTNERIQAAPILARFKSRSWTAPPQAAEGRKKRAKRFESNRTDGHPEANGGMERQ